MKRTIILSCLLLAVISFFTSCNNNSDNNLGFPPLDKKFWTPDDYQIVNNVLSSLNSEKSTLPNLDDPKTSPIFNKIADTANISVVSNDTQLGLTHRHEFLKNMFEQYKDLSGKYSSLDQQDKYVYPSEYIRILIWGLYLQIPYIQVGNDKILKDATNPDDAETKNMITDNRQILIKNYNLYLEHINYEDRFSDKSIAEYTQGLDDYFPKLITQIIPDGDYSSTLELVTDMLKKAKNKALIEELQKIETLITSKQKK